MKRLLTMAAILGAAAGLFGFAFAPEKFWTAALVAALYPLTLSLGAAVFLAIQDLTGAEWSREIEEVPQAMTRCYWPAAAAVLAALVLGSGGLHGWASPAAAGAHGAAHPQQSWLAPGFVLARAAAVLVLWGVLLRRRRGAASAAAFVVTFGVTFSLASFDWLMSIEPGWYSTMFGIHAFSGLFLGSLAAVAALSILHHRRSAPSPDCLHDLGRLIFGFSVFWAYIWYCQYMLIWYTNIPEETSFFARRHAGAWAVISLASVGLNWVLPFLVLLPQWTKRSGRVLLFVSLAILIGRWLDLYVAAMPRFSAAPGIWEWGLFLGATAGFVLLYLRRWPARTD